MRLLQLGIANPLPAPHVKYQRATIRGVAELGRRVIPDEDGENVAKAWLVGEKCANIMLPGTIEYRVVAAAAGIANCRTLACQPDSARQVLSNGVICLTLD
jgi:hypothetical protein